MKRKKRRTYEDKQEWNDEGKGQSINDNGRGERKIEKEGKLNRHTNCSRKGDFEKGRLREHTRWM